MAILRSPLCWFGGKGRMVKKLLKHIPQHKIYVEVFGGGASLLFAKQPSSVEVYNDIDSNLVNLFRVLRDEEKFEKFYRKVCLTPYSREEFYYCAKTWQDCEDEIEKAYRFYILARMSLGGMFASGWGYIVNESNKNMASTCSGWLSIIEMLPQIHARLMRVQIEHDDFRKIIRRYDTQDTFFYLDPPYLPETRKSREYKHEMTTKDHEELVELLLNIKGKALLSGYPNDLYKKLEDNGWVKVEYDTACQAVGRTRGTKILGKGAALKLQPRTECIWKNYAGDLF